MKEKKPVLLPCFFVAHMLTFIFYFSVCFAATTIGYQVTSVQFKLVLMPPQMDTVLIADC